MAWLVLWMVGAALAAAPATQPVTVDQSTPKAALKTFAAVTRAADAQAMAACLHASDDMEKKMAAAMVDMAVSIARLRLVAIEKFGEEGAKPFSGGVPTEEEIKKFDAAIEQIDGDKALVTVPAADKVNMVQVQGAWKISVGHSIAGQKPEKLEADIKQMQATAKAIAELIEEISAGKHKTAQEAVAALQKKMQKGNA
jgi:hypothetical protein